MIGFYCLLAGSRARTEVYHQPSSTYFNSCNHLNHVFAVLTSAHFKSINLDLNRSKVKSSAPRTPLSPAGGSSTPIPQSTDFWLCTWLVVFAITIYLPSCFSQERTKDLSIFDSSCHLPIYLPHMVEALQGPFSS